MSSGHKITLISTDGEAFVVPKAEALEFLTLYEMIANARVDNLLQLPAVTRKTLSKVLDYSKKHSASPPPKDLKAWNAEFVNVDPTTLIDLVLAAKCMKMENLLKLTCQAVVDIIKGGKTTKEIHKILNIKDGKFILKHQEEVRPVGF